MLSAMTPCNGMLAPAASLAPYVALTWTLLAAACASPLYELESETERSPPTTPIEATPDARVDLARALPRPTVIVEPPPSGPDAVVTAGTVVVHSRVRRGFARLVIAPDNGQPRIFTYTPPGGARLPVPSGSQARVRFYPQSPPLRRGWALIVEDARGRLLAAVFSGDGEAGRQGWGLPNEALPPGLAVDPHRQVVYSELKRLETACLAMLEHRQVRIQSGGAFAYLRPGTFTNLELRDPSGGAASYRLMVLDASILVDARCAGEQAGHFTWALVANPRRGPVVPVAERAEAESR